jgi:Zn-dependent protease/predicted transcriptional regulator
MKWSLQLGRYFGIPVSIHWTFIFILIYVAWMGFRSGLNNQEVIINLLLVLSVFLCVLLHEFGHALMAKRFGIKTHSIVLLPIGGIASLEKMPDEPKKELLVALAGPLVNFVIVLILYPFVDFAAFSNAEQANYFFSGEVKAFLGALFMVNIILAVFNLLPAFPMDGGRVLRALLGFSMPAHRATLIAARVGQFMAILFVIIAIITSNYILILIGAFIFMGARAESEMKTNQFIMTGYKVRDIMLTEYITLDVKDTIGKAVDVLLKTQSSDFLIMDGEKFAGILSRNDLIKTLHEKGKDEPISSAVSESAILSPEDTVEKVYMLAHQTPVRMWPVMENGKLIGALDYENIMEFVMVRSAIGETS